MNNKLRKRLRKIAKIREKVFGTSSRPRIAVFRSNKRIYVQAIDDTRSVTIASASDAKLTDKTAKITKAEKVGQMLAEKLVKLGIKTAVFDRRGYKFHGRTKALTEGVREKGVKF